jgi:metal-responsive CopG/Arc/MetJ family transcriptional regulator
MQVTRVTLSLPNDLWEDVKKTIPARQRSSVIARAIEAEMQHRKRQAQLENLRQFQKTMREKYGELPSSATDIEEMRQERCGDDR